MIVPSAGLNPTRSTSQGALRQNRNLIESIPISPFLEPPVKRFLLFAVIACLTILNPALSFAQFETASVLGYVRDSSGAALPNSTVILINRGTGAEVTLKTNAEGAYEFTDVKIGSYQVTAQAAGFETGTTQAFQVQVNAHQRVDVSLKVGSTSEDVTVSGAAAHRHR
jgi:hypothetical protein